MAKRERQNELKIYLSDDEQYILEQKWKASNMKSKSAFIRHLILYGYVYDVNYEHLREYNTILSRIGNNLNQIAKRMNATGNVYEADVKEVKELMKQVWQSQKSIQKLRFLIYLIIRKFSLHGTKFSFILPIAFFNAKNSIMLRNLFSIFYRGFRTIIV